MAVDLDKIRKKYEDLKKKTSSSGNFFDYEEGNNWLRILSYADGRDFYKEVGYHYHKQGKERKPIVCLQMTVGQECYVCELIATLEKSTDKGDKAFARELHPTMRVFYNAIDRRDNTLKILPSGNQVFKQLLGYIQDVDWGDLTNPVTGRDVNIIKTRTGKGTTDVTYDVRPKPLQTPVGVEYDEADLVNFDEFIVLPTKDEQREVFEGSDPAEESPVQVEKPAPAPAAPVEQPVRQPQRMPKKAAPAPEPATVKPELTESFKAKLSIVDLSSAPAMKAFEKWKKEDGTENGLDDLIEIFGSTAEEATDVPAPTPPAASEGELDDAITKALSKYKTKK